MSTPRVDVKPERDQVITLLNEMKKKMGHAYLVGDDVASSAFVDGFYEAIMAMVNDAPVEAVL